MKTKFFIIAIIVFVTSIFSASANALTKQWTYDLGTDTNNLEYSVDQIAADGKGGCAVVWKEENTDTRDEISFVAYFDKKGNKVWERSYSSNMYIEIAYCTKKMTIFCVSPGYEVPGNKITVTIDKKGNETVFEKPGTHVDGNFNSETIPLGDKKGFFAERNEVGYGKCSIVRYTYK